MEIYIDSGIGDDIPRPENISKTLTVGQLRTKYASKFGVPSSNVQIVDDLSTTLSNDRAKVSSLVSEGDTIHITPRAKAGC